MTIDRQMVEGRFGRLKTEASARTVPLDDDTLDVLAAHFGPLPDAALGTRLHDADGPAAARVLPNRAWVPARRVAAIEWARWHDLRHYCASALIEGGCSVKAVQRVLGHASAKVTLDVYTHLFDGRDEHGARRRGGGEAKNARLSADSPSISPGQITICTAHALDAVDEADCRSAGSPVICEVGQAREASRRTSR